MTTRPLKASDLPKLAEMAKKSGFQYPDIATLDHIEIVENDEGDVIMAAGLRLVPEVYLWCGEFKLPLAKVHAIKILHVRLGEMAKRYGWKEVNATFPPSIAEKLGRRFEKSFGWKRSWPSWFKVL